jgi:hypothetical protein
MSDALIPSVELLRRTLAADISYTVSRMKVLEAIPGNPIGIAYRWFDDGAVALMARLPSFCRVVGLRPGHEHHIEPVTHWYAEHDIKPTFELVPGQYDTHLGRELARLGFYHSSFHASLIGQPGVAEHLDDGGAIELDDRFHETGRYGTGDSFVNSTLVSDPTRSCKMAGWRQAVELALTDEEIEMLAADRFRVERH